MASLWIFRFSGQASVLGPAFYGVTQFYSSYIGYVVYGAVTVLWVTVPLLCASKLLQKRGRS